MKLITLVTLSVVLVISGCSSAQHHRQAVSADADLTVGKVQREIRVGMSGADVAAVLGSPNIVSTDEQRREVWIYDKIATDNVYSSDSGGVSALILGGGPVGAGLLGGAGSTGYSAGSGASSRSQRTLTVIIKFNEQGKVRDFAYHTSRF
ncbi:MAG: hypothetical protein J5J00_09090 [Deltaproteobacteria bacterium]|nr:hypothetical protein [Deltaproteobacteria bacterium]